MARTRLLFCSNLFLVLYAPCNFMGISFFRLENFSFMVLLKVFLGSLIWDYSFSIPIIVRFVLLRMSQNSMMLMSVVPLYLFRLFQFQNSLSLCFPYCFYFHFQVSRFICFLKLFIWPFLVFFKGLIHLLQLFVCLFLDVFKVFIYFFFKDLYHLHKVGFKAFLCLCCVIIFKACFNRLAGLWW